MTALDLDRTVTQSELSVTEPPSVETPATYRDVFSVAEFRTVFVADLCSLAGDQIAAVAVAVLLYQRSGSALLAALGYATAYLPWLLGGPLLAAWAERFAGRRVLVACDLGRAALIGLAAIPGLSLAAVGVLVLAAALLAPPFDSARSALLPQILTGERYLVGASVRDAVHQGAQLAGFALGGLLVVAVSPPGALALDAFSFALSALVLRFGLTPRSVARPASSSSLWAETRAGLHLVRTDRGLSGPLLLGVVGAGYAIVPEAIAPAYAGSLGAGPRAVGLIMAAVAGGSVVGALTLGRSVAGSARVRATPLLALAGALPLLAVALHPGLVVSLLLFALTGVASSYQIAVNARFARRVPPAFRARAFGIAICALYGAQSLAIVLAGAAAQFLAPATVVAAAGVVGVLGVIAVSWPKTSELGDPREVRAGRHRA